jgi:3'(2'), 5'-bisphosphate nucleotidase
MAPWTPSPDMAILVQLARDAGREIMAVYASEFAVRAKSDLSPVTEADEHAERIILEGLANAWPDIPVVSEEQASIGKVPVVGESFFLVDPLDGTKEFLARNGEFTVNIALVNKGVAQRGVVYAPALEQMYWGDRANGAGQAHFSLADNAKSAHWRAMQTRPLPQAGATVLTSRSHRDAKTDHYLARVKVNEKIIAGSSLKFCRIAAGEADLYPRFGRTMQWDTAAGHAVLAAAGGHVRCIDGTELYYGASPGNFDNPAFIAASAASFQDINHVETPTGL